MELLTLATAVLRQHASHWQTLKRMENERNVTKYGPHQLFLPNDVFSDLAMLSVAGVVPCSTRNLFYKNRLVKW